jgi:hypothetical protein
MESSTEDHYSNYNRFFSLRLKNYAGSASKKIFMTLFLSIKITHIKLNSISYYKKLVFVKNQKFNAYRSFSTTESQLKMCDFSGETFKDFEVL